MGPACMNGFAIDSWFESDKFNLVVRMVRCNRRERNGSTTTSAKYGAWFTGASKRKEARWPYPICLGISDLKIHARQLSSSTEAEVDIILPSVNSDLTSL